MTLPPEMTSHLAAATFAQLGRIDEALDWLAHMIRARGFVPYRYFAELDPFIAPSRGDPRFVALLAEMKDRYQEFDG